MDKERQRQISSQGGKAAHQKGTAHEFDSEEAREAGRKGGMVSGGRRRAREAALNTSAPREAGEEREEREDEDTMSRTSGSEGTNAPAGHGA